MTDDPRRNLPSVAALLETAGVRSLLNSTPRSVVVDAVRRTVDDARRFPSTAPTDAREWDTAIAASVARATQASLRPAINATGVVLHTNLGRAPLAAAAIDAIVRVAAGFSNLEYQITDGTRGSRYGHCAGLLQELTGAEDALVVNNGAAALVLALNTLAEGRDAIVSRGELIEIGGSFRIPDIMAKSGVRLVEVGTTNRTHAEDYRRAVNPSSGAIVKVHRSNFEVAGFVADASSVDLGALANERNVPFIYDLGSGLLLSLAEYGLSGEPTAIDAVRSGASVVTMSGDKLLGGPQAGLILGTRDAIERIRTNPLTRSYRVDKLTLAALEATLALYREPSTALREIPALAQLTASVDALRERAQHIQRDAQLANVEIVDTDASVGGGAFPTAKIPSIALTIAGNATDIERRLREHEPPVISRVTERRVLLDVRTVMPHEDETLAAAIRAVVA